MMELLQGFGAKVTRQGPLLRVEVAIPARPDELPATATGRVFESVASAELPPFRLRLLGMPDDERGAVAAVVVAWRRCWPPQMSPAWVGGRPASCLLRGAR